VSSYSSFPTVHLSRAEVPSSTTLSHHVLWLSSFLSPLYVKTSTSPTFSFHTLHPHSLREFYELACLCTFEGHLSTHDSPLPCSQPVIDIFPTVYVVRHSFLHSASSQSTQLSHELGSLCIRRLSRLHTSLHLLVLYMVIYTSPLHPHTSVASSLSGLTSSLYLDVSSSIYLAVSIHRVWTPPPLFLCLQVSTLCIFYDRRCVRVPWETRNLMWA